MNPEIKAFQKKIYAFFKDNRRDFPWRNTTDPYKILVSEVMLQQTQTSRVVEKYLAFIKSFPDTKTLAGATFPEVLRLWQGLGYNRRAMWLKKSSEIISKDLGGIFPNTQKELTKLPGIGTNTAGAIVAFAFNEPVVFIETNIRRVFIHDFFKDAENISDEEILPLIEEALPPKDVREWYYALMDYGVFLAKQTINPNRKSKHYSVQSKFKGSMRQTRGEILKELLIGSQESKDVKNKIKSEHFKIALEQLMDEGFVEKNGKVLQLKS